MVSVPIATAPFSGDKYVFPVSRFVTKALYSSLESPSPIETAFITKELVLPKSGNGDTSGSEGSRVSILKIPPTLEFVLIPT